MSQPFVGEIRPVPFNFAPNGWAFCDGSLLAISDYSALFYLLGTTYGGDGVNTFALPNLSGRLPIGVGEGPGLSNYTIGQAGGSEVVTITHEQMPAHSHGVAASLATASTVVASGHIPAQAARKVYDPNANGATTAAMAADSIQATGGNQGHSNLQPYTTVSYIIALYGVFPSQN